MQEQYYIQYSPDPDNLVDTNSIPSVSDTSVINATYSIVLTGLQSGAVYYARVVAVYDEVFERFSEMSVFLTKAPGKFFSDFSIFQVDRQSYVHLQRKHPICSSYLVD